MEASGVEIMLSLPAEVQPGLRSFVSTLDREFARELACLVVYGPVARGRYSSGLTEVNLMLVLRNLGREQLRNLVAPLQELRRQLPVDLLTFSVPDLRRSTDVFPLRLLEVKRSYKLLAGEDLVAPLFISGEHVRLACEHEAKITVLRLRQQYLVRAGLRPAFLEAMTDSVRQFVRLLGFSLELAGREVGDDLDGLLQRVESEIGIPRTMLTRVLALRSGRERPDPRELEELFEDYLDGAVRLAIFVDRLSRA